jgi:hypothetical protein
MTDDIFDGSRSLFAGVDGENFFFKFCQKIKIKSFRFVFIKEIRICLLKNKKI